jgi:drug/metabolite transporter (DMT)-like permease
MNNIRKTLGLLFLCLAWGSTWVAIKVTLEGFPPLLGAAARFSAATVIMFFYLKLKGLSFKISAREFKLLVITAFLIYVLDYGFIYWGEQYLSAGVTAILFSTFAIFTALQSNFLFKSEAFSGKRFFGLLVGFGGVLIVFFDQLVRTKFNVMVILASLAILVAAISAAMSTVVIKKYLPRMNSIQLTFHQLVWGSLFLVLLGLGFEDPAKIRLDARVVTSVLYMGIIASALAFVVYYKLLQNMSAISLSLIIYIIPIVALFSDYLFFKKIPSLHSFIGMLVIFSGIWLSRKTNRKT